MVATSGQHSTEQPLIISNLSSLTQQTQNIDLFLGSRWASVPETLTQHRVDVLYLFGANSHINCALEGAM